ncbi:MAG: 4Fe-4S domain-containing protein [Nitrososphaerales archaeon]
MQAIDEERKIGISDKAYEILAWARKEGETLSDVILRLASKTLEGLQRRGEKTIETSDGTKLILSIDQTKCLGAESCVVLAPSVFALDHSTLREEPLGMRVVLDKSIDRDTIIRAAVSCPYKAINVKEASTDEELVP